MILIQQRVEGPYQVANLWHTLLHFALLHGTGLEVYGTLNAPSWAVSTEFISAAVLSFVFAQKATIRTRLSVLIFMTILFKLEVIDLRLSLCCIALLTGTLVYDASTTLFINRVHFRFSEFLALSTVLSIVAYRLTTNRDNFDGELSSFVRESYLVDLLIIASLLYMLLTKVHSTRSWLTKTGKLLGGALTEYTSSMCPSLPFYNLYLNSKKDLGMVNCSFC